MPNDVTALHPEYQAALTRWTRVNDAAAGSDAVKEKKEAYLPRPNCRDTSPENTARYTQYIARAVFYNATGRTILALSGLAFGKWPEIKLPAGLDAFEKNVTGSGVPLIQHAQSTVNRILATGRGGLLADFPVTNGDVSVADQQTGGLQPTLCFYGEDAITNWRRIKRGSRMIPSLVVLKETHEIDAGFELKQETQYRVLQLSDVGLYQVAIYRKRIVEGKEQWVVAEGPWTPLQGNGKPWDEIPFQFIGSHNNDACVDPSPMADIAEVNVGHYRNSADYEDSVYIVGQPQVWMSGLDQTWYKMLKDDGVYLGSRQILALPVGGAAGMLQADPNTLAKEAMDQKERQMAALGARLIAAGGTDGGPAKTKGQVVSEDTAAHSVLSLVCDNVSMAYEQALAWAANFANINDGAIEFSIPTEFTKVIDAQTAEVLLKMVQAGKMPTSDLWNQLRVAGFIRSDKTDEEIREEIDAEPPPTDGALTDDAGGGSAGSGAGAA